jgi:hypothetical protein
MGEQFNPHEGEDGDYVPRVPKPRPRTRPVPSAARQLSIEERLAAIQREKIVEWQAERQG